MPGVALSGDLSTGQSHTYQITLDARQFVAITIAGTGDDPVITLVDPSGRTLLDSARGELSIITSTGGRYLVRVRVNDEAPTRVYDIGVGQPRPPMAADVARAAGDVAFSDGASRAADRSAGGTRAGIDRLEAALASFREAGHRRGETLVLLTLGRWYGRLPNEERAERERLTAAIALARATGDVRREAEALQWLGSSYRGETERRTALEYYGRSLALAESIGHRSSANGVTTAASAGTSLRMII